MRRPHRSIETFDISLMAVVTKAMGAFLVMMLLLMPYYKSGPIGEKAATDLAEKVEQVDQKIREVAQKLNTASAEDLRKLLDETLQLLNEARRLIAELKRANDALQSQVKRLEDEVATLQGRVASLQARIGALEERIAALEGRVAQLQGENQQLRGRIPPLEKKNEELQEALDKFKGNKLFLMLTNVDCAEQFALHAYEPGMTVSVSDGTQSPNLLNFGSRAREAASGTNWAFYATGGLEPGTRYMIARLHKRGAASEEIMPGARGMKLKSATADCAFQVALYGDRGNNTGFTYPLRRWQVKQGQYAVLLGELEVKENEMDWKASTDASERWFQDKINLAAKED